MDSAVEENLGLKFSTSRGSDEEPPLTQTNPRKCPRSVSANPETDVQVDISMACTISCKQKPNTKRAWRA